MRIIHNISFTDIHVSFFARIYSAASLKARVILSGYPIPALINTGAEICLILRKIINKINAIYTLNRRIVITDASKKVIYIERICNN